MSFLKSARHLASIGFHVFPLVPNAKLPAVKAFTDVASYDEEKLKAFWLDPVLELEQPFNIGIITSKFFGGGALLVVDVDNKNNKQGSLEVLKLELGGFDFPKTLTQLTPSGGLHYIYKVKTPVKQGVNVLADGLDIRSRGGFIVGAGSMTEKGKYKINSTPLADAPAWMIEKCNAVKTREARTEKPSKKVSQKGAKLRARTYLLESAPVAIEGAGGDQTTFKVASKLKDMGLTPSNCLDLMFDNWNDNCQPPWDHDELKQKVENAYTFSQNTTGADSPEADFENLDNDNDKAEEAVDPIEDLNKEFAFIIMGGKSTILRQYKGGEVSYLHPSAFHDLLKASTMQAGNGRKKQVSEMWMQSHRRATFSSAELIPCKQAPPGVYNLWRGWSCEPLKTIDDATQDMKDGVAMFKEHAFENVCREKEELYTWLMQYFAQLIQYPGTKPLTALVFKGRKGVGKNAFINCIGNLFGHHYLLTSNKRYLLSNFNKHLANLLLFVLDEAFWSGDKAAEGILKDLITGDRHLIEQKGREMYKATNILRVCILGNEDWVVPASEDERRFAIFNVGNKRQQDKAFFIKMSDMIHKKGGNQLLMRELLDMDLKNADINTAPDTIGLLEQKIESLNPIHSWVYSSLKEGIILNLDFSTNEEWPTTVGREFLRNAYLAYAKQRGIRSWLPDAATFGRDLGKALPGVKNQRMREGNGRQRVYSFPSLAKCRGEFEQFIGHVLEWEDDELDNVIDVAELFS